MNSFVIPAAFLGTVLIGGCERHEPKNAEIPEIKADGPPQSKFYDKRDELRESLREQGFQVVEIEEEISGLQEQIDEEKTKLKDINILKERMIADVRRLEAQWENELGGPIRCELTLTFSEGLARLTQKIDQLAAENRELKLKLEEAEK